MKKSNLVLAVAMSLLVAAGAGAADDALVIKQARELQLAKKNDEAVKLYEANIKTKASERLYVDYAALMINLKKYKECDEMLTKAASYYPDSLRVKNALGMAKYNDARDSVLIMPCPTRTWLYNHTTVCPDLDPEMVFIPAYEEMFPKGNLHFADSWLFGGNVLENMRCRLRNHKK